MEKKTILTKISQMNWHPLAAMTASSLAAGGVAGLLSRLSMRGVALAAGGPVGFTLEGTLGLAVMGMIMGLFLGLLFFAMSRWLPVPERWKGLLYSVPLLGLVALFFASAPDGEALLVDLWLGFLLFMPIPLVFGLLLQPLNARFARYMETHKVTLRDLAWVGGFIILAFMTLMNLSTLLNFYFIYPQNVRIFLMRFGVSFTGLVVVHQGFLVAFFLVYLGLAGWIFTHARTWVGKFTSLALLAFAAGFFVSGPGTMDTFYTEPYQRVLAALPRAIGLTVLLSVLYLYPDGKYNLPGARWFTGIWFAWSLAWFSYLLPETALNPENWPQPLLMGVVLFGFGTGLAAQYLRYQKADSETRSHYRPIFLALVASLSIFALVWTFRLISPGWWAPSYAYKLSIANQFVFVPYLLPWLLFPFAIYIGGRNAAHRQGNAPGYVEPA